MVLYFSGTGNSKYIAKRIAEAIQENAVDLNMKIKENDTSPLQTGRDVIIVTPTYAWRIPKIVSEWIDKTSIYGNITDSHAGELYCHVRCTGSRRSTENYSESRT